MQTFSTKQNKGGLGFLVENLLNDFKSDSGSGDESENKTECEYNEQHEKKYDEIKKSILLIYKKIKQRKNNNHKLYNIHNESVSYINYSKVKDQYRELLKLLYADIENKKTKHRAKWHMIMLYRLLAFTRDISDGCGERELSYMQLFELARMDAAGACKALKTIILSESSKLKKKPIGSWKDVKGLVAYMRCTMNMRDERDMAAYLELTKFMVSLVNERVAKDVLAFYKDDNDNECVGNGIKNDDEVSFVSKWIPRENKSKKYGNFYERLACDYYKDWLPKDRNANPVSYEKAIVKCKIHYRKLVSTLNQYLETPQIKMCQQRWSDIVLSKTTRLTRDLQDRALLNLKSDDYRIKRHAHNSDREACAEKYKVWKCDTLNCINGIKTDLQTHVAVSKYYSANGSLASNRNAEWTAFASQEAVKNKLSHVIPVLAGNSNKAVGLALAVAENAKTGKTLILKDGGELVLHDLDASFVKNVKYLTKNMNWNSRADNDKYLHSVCGHPLYKCLISALKLLVESNVAAKQTRDSEEPRFTVAIFTDDDSSAFFDDYHISFREVLNEASSLYHEFGYGVPDVVIWAMESTICHENGGNSRCEYNSVSYGGALTIRVGCESSDICGYLGLFPKDEYSVDDNETVAWNREHAELKLKNDADCDKNKNNKCAEEWIAEWNNLVERLYCRRYYDFENHF
jgi:hypothetical protein